MDLLSELETMAQRAVEWDEEYEPSDEEVQRWQQLFKYSQVNANERIKAHKKAIFSAPITDSQWEAVRSQKEKEGFSRDAYEHWIQIKSQPNGTGEAPKHVPNTIPEHAVTYLILLEGILSAPEDLQSTANLPEPPAIYQGSSETEDASFCKVDGTVKRANDQWLTIHKSTFRPTYVRLNKAKKDLSSVSIHPTLGRESTLPQH